MSDSKKSNSIFGKQSYSFALDIIVINKFINEQKREFILSKQLIRSGSSIKANVHEAFSSGLKKNFIHKFFIALKESIETSNWENFLKDSDYISVEQFGNLNNSCGELIKILSSIILTMKRNIFLNQL